MSSGSLLFYAVASFYLGLITIAVGGSDALGSAIALLGFPGDFGFDRLLAAMTVIVPFVFIGLALIVSRRESRG